MQRSRWSGPKSRRLCRKFPLYPEARALKRGRRRRRDPSWRAWSGRSGPDGPLARALAEFEPRAGQVEMAAAVAGAFEHGRVLLAEAGTGTGKTLAYLVPAILSRQRVLDLHRHQEPSGADLLQGHSRSCARRSACPSPPTYMKGRANYLCLHRLDQLGDEARTQRCTASSCRLLREWASRTETGDRAELEDLPEDLAFWNEVSATADTCLGTECPRYDDCFVTRMRQRAAAADVVIVNHHLLCADAAVRQGAYGEVIPACSFAVDRRGAPARRRRDAVLRDSGEQLPASRISPAIVERARSLR